MPVSVPAVAYDSIVLQHPGTTGRVYVLLHGLTASPRQFETFGRLLFERGSNVSIPRLPRHGQGNRLTTDLRNLTAAELRAFAEQALAEARSLGDEVVIVGFSVGGLLSAWLAHHHVLTASVSIAPFLGTAWLPDRLIGIAAQAVLFAPNRFIWWDPFLRERHGTASGYPRFSTHAVAHAATLARDLLADAQRTAPRTADLRIVINSRESTVSNAAARRLAQSWCDRNGRVSLHRLQGLPLCHDIITLRPKGHAGRVYPTLLDLVAA